MSKNWVKIEEAPDNLLYEVVLRHGKNIPFVWSQSDMPLWLIAKYVLGIRGVDIVPAEKEPYAGVAEEIIPF